MRPKNIVLVQVADAYGPNKFLPLAIACQWLYASESVMVRQQYNVVDVLIEKLDITQWLDSLPHELHVVAMSCYIWNWRYNQTLGQAIKAKFPNCKVVVGGPQITKHDANFVRDNPWIDVAILGENEAAFRQYLENLDLRQITDMPGVITRHTQKILQPSRTQDLNSIPSPMLTGFYDNIMQKYAAQGVTDIMWQVTWETMRGCPYRCSFCDIGDEYWNKTKWFDIQRIRAEINWMAANKIEYVSVCDSNWGIHSRDIDITQCVIDAKLHTGFPRILDVTWAKNTPDRVREIVMRDQRAGSDLFRGVNFSMQSLDPDTLQRSSRFNLTDSITYNSMQFFKDHLVPTYTELIWPMPGETLDSFTQGLQKLIDIGQRDFVSVHPLVLTPNAPMGQPEYCAKHEIKSQRVPLDIFWLRLEDPKNYIVEYVDAVQSTGTASFDDMLQGHMIAHWLVVLYYYGWAHYVMKYLRRRHQVEELEFVLDWMRYLQDRDDWVADEHRDIMHSLRGVFEQGHLWGRRVTGDDDVLWEYKSATSVFLSKHRSQWWLYLQEYLKHRYDIDPRVVELNDAMNVDWQRCYPITLRSSQNILMSTLDIDAECIEINHHDIANIHDEILFVHKAYHWRRKQCYWRCNAQPL